MASNADKLVADYLKTLDRELRGVPSARREELRGEISEHIAEARAGLDTEDESSVREILTRLGDPSEIAASERPSTQGRAGWREIVALILLPIGGILLPIIGWVVGAALLWASEAWSTKDKLVGTLLFPGGLLIPAALFLMAEESSGCGSIVSPQLQPQQGALSCPPADGVGAWEFFVMGALIVVPLATIAYLARRVAQGQARSVAA